MLDFEKGILHLGNLTRLRRVMDRAAAGEEITVAFIGGSITQGSLASTPEGCYAYCVYRWWAERYANVRYLNGGIGGTTSQFGVARVEEDILSHNPSVVFIEFTVNDENTPHFAETYEGLVRRTLASGAAVVLLHTICFDSGDNAEAQHLPIAKHYDLPCVSIRPTLYDAAKSGCIPVLDITPDNLHPNDLGHRLFADGIIHLLEKVLTFQPLPEGSIPAPLTENSYEHSVRHQNHNSTPVLEGFLPDPTPQKDITEMFRRGFTAWKMGEKITFLVEGTGIAVQYRKSVRRPAPIARVRVDGEQEKRLDANFEEDWGDCLHIDTVLAHGENRLHTVEIELVETHENDAVPFYLVSVIGSK